jgi:hypothetical protein
VAARRAAATLSAPRAAGETRDVLADLASSLREWLTAELSPGTVIGFDPPHVLAGMARRPQRAGIVNVFLYGITEDLDGIPAARVRVLNDEGRLTGTVAPARNYHLTYLVTAWAADTEEEAELLGAVIGAHAERDALGGEHLRGCLRELDTALPVRLGWTPGGRGHDLWSALGVPMRTALDLTVTAPVQPSRLRPPAPPVKTAELDVHDTVRGLPPEPRPRWRRTSITER